jgi:pimeloyl-ACP methyl ester carboxylesterase
VWFEGCFRKYSGLAEENDAYDPRLMATDAPVFRRAAAHGQTFVYTDSGDGPLVVLLHGFPDTPAGWSGTATSLNAAGYRTVVPYLRGYHPETIALDRGYGREELAQDPIWLLDALEEQSAVLVGHDWGAALTYGAATLAPERVRAICAVAIPHPSTLKPSVSLLWGGRHFVTLRLPTGAWLARRADFAYLDTLMRRWAPRWSGHDRDATLGEVKRAFADPAVLDGALAYYKAQRPGGAPRLSQPALVVGGTTDIVPVALFDQTPSYCDGPCEVAIIEGAGHWPHRENPRLFEQRLIAFLDGLERQ